uniref:Protein translocase subunit SecA n=1 Tax=Harveyella mirabilis TaxID=282355 RepID=A0A3S8UW14_9FLOR|nr:preprotein-translocase subunit a [Harveyella mirabilis]
MLNLCLNTSNNQYKTIINQINKIYLKLHKYSDKQLNKQTYKLQIQLQNVNLSINSILAEAFATVKEAIYRAIGITIFDIQILGGIILHENNIAEIKTGEGKTLIALLPAYFNCLVKKSVHIVTTNDYLAKRDFKLAFNVFSYLNTSIGLITQYTPYKERQKEYNKQITYITNNELGFDYLKDHLAVHKKHLIQKKFHYAIIDEIDSILIDEARTPLIISGLTKIKDNLYKKAQIISNILTNSKHYKIDEKSKNIILTEIGILLCEQKLNISNLYEIDNPWIKYIINALKAKELFLKNKDYIIKNNKIIIVDEFTGRIMKNRRWSDGLHQSIEAKENIKIKPENQILASITYQNLFLLYPKLCGMTGTARTEENEFLNIYKMKVISLLPNTDCIRKDLPDLVYKFEYNKWQSIANECLNMYQIGRPTLIGTKNIEKSELLAKMLKKLKIPYNLLNAKSKYIEKEAEIIIQAGKKFAITISTNMAGRGTDIILGGNPQKMTEFEIKDYLFKQNNISNYRIKNIKEILTQTELKVLKKKGYFYKKNKISKKHNHIKLYQNKALIKIYQKLLKVYSLLCKQEKNEILKLGGLYVIGTEKHESRRIDNQLRGRSGRQGEKGISRFFLSLQDNLFRIFGGKNLNNFIKTLNIKNNLPIKSIILTQSLNLAQKKVEIYFYKIRKSLFHYDDVINYQRRTIYKERNKILNSSFTRNCIIEYTEYTINEILQVYIENNKNKKILKKIIYLINIYNKIDMNILKYMNINQIQDYLNEQFRINYDLKEIYLECLRPGLIRKLEKYYLLQQIDKTWQKHISNMNMLKEYINWRSYGEENPLIEYKNEAFHLFIHMITSIRQTVTYLITRSKFIV